MSKRNKNRGKKTFGRKENSNNVRERILIVFEGGKTEPDYFDDMRVALRLNRVNVVVHRTGNRSSPKTIVKDAQSYIDKEEENFDAVFCVFDKDQHGNSYTEALCTIDGKEKFVAINSVPCFEFWILLHFNDSLSPHDKCMDVIKILNGHIDGYSKGMNGIFSRIQEDTDIAISRAKQAENTAKKTDTDNPTTKVYQLVERMREMAKALKR